MDEQLRRELLAEVEEHLDALYGDVESLRARGGEGRARRELVGRIFRRVHSFKGSASIAGLDGACKIAHEFETLLDAVRAGRTTFDEPVCDAFESALGALAESLRGEDESRTRAAVESLRSFAASRTADSSRAARADDAARRVLDALPDELSRALGTHERRLLAEAMAEGARPFLVTADFDLSNFEEQFRALGAALAEAGEIVATLPGGAGLPPERIGFRILLATTETHEQQSERAARFDATVTEVPGGVVERDGGETAAAKRTERRMSTRDSSAPSYGEVRVSLDELDRLVSAAHELFNDAMRALDLAPRVESGGAELSSSDARAAKVRRRFVELEEGLIGLRMTTVGRTLERAARAGRAVARASGKSVEFVVRGGDARLDKAIAERVADPLLHLVRNAVDHGLEPSAERLAAGKPERGAVRLEAAAEGGSVTLRVADDGRGINPELVARAATARGLLPEGSRLTESQALRLIFRPGFSTATELSTFSGRGVGLDVVERAIELAGGELLVWTRAGAGTTFEMRLPTTLALMRATFVSSGGHRYCLDARGVVETYEDLHEVNDAGLDGSQQEAEAVTNWRGRKIPLVRLGELLGQPARATRMDEGARVVIVRRGEDGGAAAASTGAYYALLVDELLGEGEVLVRGLGRHAKRWRGVSGATELDDGTVALVLDLPRLIEAQPRARA